MDLLLFLLVFPAFSLAGDKICAKAPLEFSSFGERFVVATALGILLASGSTLLLAFFGGVYPAALWTLVALAYLVQASRIRDGVKTWASRKQAVSVPFFTLPSSGFNRFNAGILILLGLLSLFWALAPPIKTDALVYHLALPKTYLQNHGLVHLPNNVYSFFPLQMEMVYLFCLGLGGEALAQLTGLGVTGLLLGSLILFGRNNVSNRAHTLAAVVVFSTPTFFYIAASAYVDLAAAAFLFLSFYAWDAWRTRNERGWFYLMAVFAAAAVTTKIIALIALPLVFLGIVLQGKEQETPAGLLKNLGIFCLIVILFLFPWGLRNAQYTGNPFAPFLMQIFGGEEGINWDPERARLMGRYVQSFGMGRALDDFLLLPQRLTFFAKENHIHFDGRVGILYLMLLPSLAWLWGTRSPKIRHLGIVFLILFVYWFLNFQYVRFLALPFVFLSLLLTAGTDRMIYGAPPAASGPPASSGTVSLPPWGRRTVLLLIGAGILFNLGILGQPWLKAAPYRPVLGLESREQYLERNVSFYPIYRAMNQTLDPEARVLFIFMRNLGFLAERDFYSDSVFEAYTVQRMLKRDPSVPGLARQLKALGITHILFDVEYLFGNRPAFTRPEQEALKNFFNAKTKMVTRKNGYYLYRIVLN